MSKGRTSPRNATSLAVTRFTANMLRIAYATDRMRLAVTGAERAKRCKG